MSIAIGVTLSSLGLIVVFTLLWRSVLVVPYRQVQIMERNGRYTRTLLPGLHFRVPVLEHVRERVDTRLQVVSIPPRSVQTRDHSSITVDLVIYVRVVDAHTAVYSVANFILAIEQIIYSSLNSTIGSLDVEDALSSRERIETGVWNDLEQHAPDWGCAVETVELKSLEPPQALQEALDDAIKAKIAARERKGVVDIAAAQIVAQAEAEKQAAILRAEGEARAREILARADGRSERNGDPAPDGTARTDPPDDDRAQEARR